MTISASVSRILDNARINLPGATDLAIQEELYNVLKEFFWETSAWRNDLTVNAVPNTTTYALTPIDNGVILRLISLVDPVTFTEIQSTMQTPGTLILKVAPGSAITYTATVALTVTTVDGDNIPVSPSWFYDSYGLGIQDGLIGRMMAQPAKVYSNERMSIFHLRKFRNIIAQARADAQRKNLYRAQAWSFPKTFSVTRKGTGVGTSSLTF